MTLPTRESRLLLLIEATYLGRVTAATDSGWQACPWPVLSDGWCWFAEAYERELLRLELERVRKEAGV